MLSQNLKLKIFFLVIILGGIFGVAGKSFGANPVIYPVSSTTGVTGANITWSTDIAADSRVDYGTTTAYGSSVTDISSVTWHHLTISGLEANTTYHFKVISGATVSDDYIFTTYANPTGTVRTVGNGKAYSTIQACANVAVAGDTCLIYAGTYSEDSVVPAYSGSAGNYITFLAQEQVIVDSFNIDYKQYIALKGLVINTSIRDAIHAYGAHYMLIENNLIMPSGGMGIKTLDGNEANNAVIRKNTVYLGDNNNAGIYAYGDNVLIEDNDISGGSDAIEWGAGSYGKGWYNVIRNNIIHHHSHESIGGSEHIDGLQFIGGTYGGYTLIENNIDYICRDGTGNCHFIYSRAPLAGGENIDTVIIRYNYGYNIQNTCIGVGSHLDASFLTNWMVYNNTCATEALTASTGECVGYDKGQGSAKNNICYETTANDWSPTYGGTGNSYNLAYNQGYSGNWDSPYSLETTFLSLKNQNPGFINYPTSFDISSNSSAKDAGGQLTTVASGDSGSGAYLVVADAHYFQPGWAGTHADWIAVGTVSNTAQIQSINYFTNTITLANNILRSNGDPVWLYKKSDGARVLYGTAPDIGAHEYSGTDAIPPAAPGGLSIN